LLAIDNDDRIDLDQVAGDQRVHSRQGVGWLVIPEQCHPALFDRWQALVTPVTDGEDRYLSYWSGRAPAAVSARPRLASTWRAWTARSPGSTRVAVLVFRFLAGDENSLLPVATATWAHIRRVGGSSGDLGPVPDGGESGLDRAGGAQVHPVPGGVVAERQQSAWVTGDLRGCLRESGAVGRAGRRQAGFPAAGRNATSPRTRSWNSSRTSELKPRIMPSVMALAHP
jgi:hypothetical protein